MWYYCYVPLLRISATDQKYIKRHLTFTNESDSLKISWGHLSLPPYWLTTVIANCQKRAVAVVEGLQGCEYLLWLLAVLMVVVFQGGWHHWNCPSRPQGGPDDLRQQDPPVRPQPRLVPPTHAGCHGDGGPTAPREGRAPGVSQRRHGQHWQVPTQGSTPDWSPLSISYHLDFICVIPIFRWNLFSFFLFFSQFLNDPSFSIVDKD